MQGGGKVRDWRGGGGFRKRGDGLTMPSSKRRASEENCLPRLLLVVGFLLCLLQHLLYLEKTGRPGEWKDQVVSPCCFSGCIGKSQLWGQRSRGKVTCPAEPLTESCCAWSSSGSPGPGPLWSLSAAALLGHSPPFYLFVVFLPDSLTPTTSLLAWCG